MNKVGNRSGQAQTANRFQDAVGLAYQIFNLLDHSHLKMFYGYRLSNQVHPPIAYAGPLSTCGNAANALPALQTFREHINVYIVKLWNVSSFLFFSAFRLLWNVS